MVGPQEALMLNNRYTVLNVAGQVLCTSQEAGIESKSFKRSRLKQHGVDVVLKRGRLREHMRYV